MMTSPPPASGFQTITAQTEFFPTFQVVTVTVRGGGDRDSSRVLITRSLSAITVFMPPENTRQGLTSSFFAYPQTNRWVATKRIPLVRAGSDPVVRTLDAIFEAISSIDPRLELYPNTIGAITDAISNSFDTKTAQIISCPWGSVANDADHNPDIEKLSVENVSPSQAMAQHIGNIPPGVSRWTVFVTRNYTSDAVVDDQGFRTGGIPEISRCTWKAYICDNWTQNSRIPTPGDIPLDATSVTLTQPGEIDNLSDLDTDKKQSLTAEKNEVKDDLADSLGAAKNDVFAMLKSVPESNADDEDIPPSWNENNIAGFSLDEKDSTNNNPAPSSSSVHVEDKISKDLRLTRNEKIAKIWAKEIAELVDKAACWPDTHASAKLNPRIVGELNAMLNAVPQINIGMGRISPTPKTLVVDLAAVWSATLDFTVADDYRLAVKGNILADKGIITRSLGGGGRLGGHS